MIGKVEARPGEVLRHGGNCYFAFGLRCTANYKFVFKTVLFLERFLFVETSLSQS